MSLRRCSVVVLVVALGMTRGAFAQRSGDPEVSARALFAEGRYAEALAIYVNLYSEKTHPTYLRNIGRCYQNLEQPDKAISSFREYLRQDKHLTSEQRGEIEGYIREMEELKRKQEASGAHNRPATSPAGGAPPVAAVAAAGPTSSEPAGALALSGKTDAGAEASASPAPGAGPRRPLAVGLVGLGVVGLGVGTWFGLDARSKWHDATNQCQTPSSTGCSLAAQQSGRSADRSADVATISLTAGGLLATAGVVLWFLSHERSTEGTATAHVQITPQVGAGAVAGVLSGTF
jgi:hypothetical protein